MKPSLFKRLVKKRVYNKAFEDLIRKKNSGQKGCYIQYANLEMATYLISKSNFSVQEKIDIFAIRCEMNDLPCNYGDKTNCEMGCYEEILNNEHLLNCPNLNQDRSKENIKYILNGSNAQKPYLSFPMTTNVS